MKAISDTLRNANSYLHRAWHKLRHYELRDCEVLLDLAERCIRKVKEEVRAERKKGGN